MLYDALTIRASSSPPTSLLGSMGIGCDSSIRMIALSGDCSLGYLYGVSGKRQQALRVITTLIRAAKHEYVDPYALAVAYAGIGDTDRAFGWLENAYAGRSASMPQMKIEPFFDPLSSDPRFQDLVRRMHFPP